MNHCNVNRLFLFVINKLKKENELEIGVIRFILLLFSGLIFAFIYAFFEQVPNAEILRAAFFGIVIAQIISQLVFGKESSIASYILALILNSFRPDIKEALEKIYKEEKFDK